MSRLSPSVVGPFLSFNLSHSHPLLPLCFVSNFAVHSCLIVKRCVQCCFTFWLTFFIGRFSIYMGIFCTKKWGATKKLFSLKIALQFDAVAPYIQQSTHGGSTDGVSGVLAAFLVLFSVMDVTISGWSIFFHWNYPILTHFFLSVSSPTLPNIRV